MDTLSSITLDNSTTLGAQRACFAPSDRELGMLMQGKYGRGLEDFDPTELATARLVFAQVALMAGAALVADSETFVGAEQLWLQMQDKIGPRDRAFACYFLERLSTDEYYSECERRLIDALGDVLRKSEPACVSCRSDQEIQTRTCALKLAERWSPALVSADRNAVADEAKPDACADTRAPDGGPQFSMRTDDASRALYAQRADFAPSERELGMMLEREYGRELGEFAADDLAIARVVFAQVTLMAGAALTADSETYMGAEQLWCEMRDKIDSRDRMLARHFLELLARDEYYSECERHLIGSLAAALTEDETPQPSPVQAARAARIDACDRRYFH